MYRAMIFLMALGFSVCSQAAMESIPSGEEQAIQTSKAIIEAGVRAEAAKTGKAVRDAHAKAHGCVKGEFQVNENLDRAFQSPVFQPGASYPTWIRYSNGSGKSQDDSVGDGRGMAIKLMGVPGKKLANEKNTQDFLMINHPVFFARNAIDYVEFSKAVATGSPLKFFFPGINPLNFRLHEMGIAKAIQGKKIASLLETQYFSMTPYLYNDRAAKFTMRPCFVPKSAVPKNPTTNYLREKLAKDLATGQGCFEFGVQFQNGAERMPVEDPTIEWSEKIAPFHRVAVLTIPRQGFLSAEQQNFCENISMNPWHSVEEHRPLGGINRARKVVYETISEVRHELNGEKSVEPTGQESF